ncbi:MAG: hypothetical protein KTR31_38530 [Myxococcales bacterium]|nr:hypothetical protein [Myxococcales bacterium]
MLTLSLGLSAGALHVLSGPDHLAALAPIALNSRTQGFRVGAQWGAGHGLGVVLLGLLGLGARHVLDPHWLSAWSEWLVGFVLIGVGAWALWSSSRDTEPTPHHTHAAVGVGLLHGAAGAGHLYGLVPALMLPVEQVLVYLGAYLAAAVLSMALFGGLLARLARSGTPALLQWLMRGSGVFAIAVGLVWLSAGPPWGG